MDTADKTEENITIDNLEKWVRNRFKYTPVGEEKNPIALAPYGESQEVHDDRQIEFHKKANKKSISDLEIVAKNLSPRLQKLRINIYQQACGVLQVTKDQKDIDTYKLAKDRIICWLLGSAAKPFSESSMGSWIRPLKNEYFGIEAKETDGTLEIKVDEFGLHQAVANLNILREEWIHAAERLNIAGKAIDRKMNDEPLTYNYLRAEESYVKLNKHGKRVIFSPPLWSSEKLAIGKEKSNAEVLPQERDWMNPLMRKITDIDFVKHSADESIRIIKKYLTAEYKAFNEEFNFEELKTPFVRGGELKKKSIALALIFILEKKGCEPVKPDAIRKRYNRLNYW